MKTLLAIDPGMATGLFWGKYDTLTPLTRLGFAQITGGLRGLMAFLRDNPIMHSHLVVCEKFDPRPMARQFRTNELEPLRIEGAVEFMFEDDVTWQRPASMVLAGGDTQAERKRKSDDILRRNGWWLTGKDVGLADANDANAAAKHALAYMRNIGHEPSISAHLSVVV
jgi:hypothetical protein